MDVVNEIKVLISVKLLFVELLFIIIFTTYVDFSGSFKFWKKVGKWLLCFFWQISKSNMFYFIYCR